MNTRGVHSPGSVAPSGGVRISRLATITDLISLEIGHEYLLGYAPSNRLSDGKFHKVRVKAESLPGRRLKIANRAGYYTLNVEALLLVKPVSGVFHFFNRRSSRKEYPTAKK
jgi:hypothetical protein